MNLKTGAHHCFGCGAKGNLASLVAHIWEISYADAVVWCNEKVGWARLSQWREDKEITSFSPSAMKVSEMDIALFIPPPEEMLEAKGITRQAADKYEILWRQEDNSWIFPVRDPYTQQLWGWQDKNDRRFRHFPAGIRRSETLFGLGAFEYGSTAILVESPIDVAYLGSSGTNGGLASFGVQISDRQFSLVREFSSHVVLALDNDIPGMDQSIRLCERDDSLRVFDYGVEPEAKDVGEMDDELSVLEGISYSISSLKFLRAVKKNKKLQETLDVYRDTGRVPKTSKDKFYRPWQSINSL